MLKISCTNTMVPGETLTEKANVLKACGFDGISIFEAIETWTEEKERELLALEAETGVKVCEFCFSGRDYGKLMCDDPAVVERSIEIYFRAIEICNKLGAVTEMEYEYAAQSPVPLFSPYMKMNEEQRARFKEIITRLAGAVSGDALLLIEPINRYESPYINTTEDGVELMDELALPNTGVLFDTFHVCIEEVDVAETFTKFAPAIKHIHLGDNNRLLPGRGNLPWGRIISAFEASGYDGFANIECAVLGDDVAGQLARAASFLRSLMS